MRRDPKNTAERPPSFLGARTSESQCAAILLTREAMDGPTDKVVALVSVHLCHTLELSVTIFQDRIGVLPFFLLLYTLCCTYSCSLEALLALCTEKIHIPRHTCCWAPLCLEQAFFCNRFDGFFPTPPHLGSASQEGGEWAVE